MGAGQRSEPARPETSAARGTVGLSSTGVFVITILVQLLGYIPTFFFARAIGETQSGRDLLGTIQLFMLIASSINGIGDLRIGSAFIYFVARGQSPTEGATTYLVLRLAMVASAGVALLLLAPSIGLSTMSSVGLFAVWMTFPVFWSVSTLYAQIYVGTGRSVRSQAPLLIESVVRMSALVYVALFLTSLTRTGGVANASNTLWALTIAYALGVAASTIYSLPAVVESRGSFSGPEAKRMFQWAWPLMGSLVLLYLAGNLIQFFVTGELGTGLYYVFLAANGYRILALALPTAVSVPLFPHLSALHKQREYEAVRSRTWQALRYTAMVVVPVVVALVVYRVNFLNIMYVHSFAVLGPGVLALLAISAVPAALSQIIGTSLNSVGQQRLELYLTSLQVGLLVLGSVLFIRPVYPISLWLGGDHLAGAGLAVLVSSLGALALNTYFMERLLAVRIQARPILTITLSAGVAFLAVSRLNQFISVNRFYILGLALILGFGVYALVLIATGELTKEDARQIARFLALPNIVGDGVARLCWRAAWPELPPVRAGEARGLLEPVNGSTDPAGSPERRRDT